MRALVGDDNSLWKPLPGFFTPGTPLYTEEGGEILKGKRDIDGAKKLLAESGYTGQPVTCVVAQDQPITKAQGDVTADLLKRIGMNVDFVATDWGTVGQRRAQKSPPGQGGWAMFHTWHAGADCVNPAVYIAVRANGDKAWFGWPNVPEVEKEVTDWFEAKNLEEEKAAVRRLNKAALDNVVYAPTGFFMVYQAWRKNVSGIVKGPLPFFWGVARPHEADATRISRFPGQAARGDPSRFARWGPRRRGADPESRRSLRRTIERRSAPAVLPGSRIGAPALPSLVRDTRSCTARTMFAYIVRRILATIPVMAIVALFVFSLLYIAPGDPAAVIAGDQATPADVERIRQSLGLDRPFLVRFGEWFWQLSHADLGRSIFTNLPVTTMIAQRIEPTLSLMVVTLILAVIGRRADGRAGGLEGRHAGSTAPSWRSRCSASRCRCSWSATCWPTSSRWSSNGCRCRATRRSRAASGRGSRT